MTFAEIKQNIRNWNNIRHDAAKIKPYFEGEVFFDFTPLTKVFGSNLALHYYPAITSEGLVLYIIDIAKDKFSVYQEDPTAFHNFILEAKLQRANTDDIDDTVGRIPRKEALRRIKNWDVHHNAWIDAKAANGGLFQAFTMDIESPGPGQITGFFGLKEVDNPPTLDYDADLILENSNRAFFNTVRPVPPFGQEGEGAYFVLVASLLEEIPEPTELAVAHGSYQY